MNNNSKTVLVAGGAGFIGTNFCRKLLEENFAVICLDNFVTGKKSNIQQFSNNPKFIFIEFDISCGMPKLKDVSKIDYTVNLACPASPVDYQKLPLETLKVCSQGTENLLKLAKFYDSRFIHASTSEVYGDPEIHPQKESYWGHVNSYGPRACYDEGKRYAEALIYVYRQKYDLATGIFRIFNTYGQFMRPRDGRVVTNFIRQALNGEDITVYGDGQQTRSFCHVDDLAEGVLKFMISNLEGPINLGNPNEFTIRELAEKIIKLTGSQSKIIMRPIPKDDPKQRCPDISQSWKKLNWKPKINLEEGLKRTIKWIKNDLN